MPVNVLAIAAHPDDEVLGCGGTLARLAQEGNDVYVAVLGEGITSRHPDRVQADPAAVDALHAACRRAAGRMGAKDPFLHRLPDNRFDTLPLLQIVKTVEAIIEKVRPRTVYSHHSGDLNIDHALVARAVLTATRPVAGTPVAEVYAFEVPSSTEWAFAPHEPAFRPDTFVNVEGTLETKIAALAEYKGEVRPFPHPRSPEALRAIARRWGSVAGLPAAEAFKLVRRIIP